MKLYVPQFSKTLRGDGQKSNYQNPASASNPAVGGIWRAREQEKNDKRFEPYRYDPFNYIKDFLGWIPWEGQGDDKPGQVEILNAYVLALRQMHEKRDWENGDLATEDLEYWTPGQVIQNVFRLEAGHTVGKTKLMSGIGQHFLDCFSPSEVTTFAPTWDSVEKMMWKEIISDRTGKGLPGRILEGECQIKINADHFAHGKATSDAKGRGTERVQGGHAAYQAFFIDESEGVADYVFKAIETMRGGGIVIVFMAANPRTRTSTFHKYAGRSYVKSFRISCLNFPNVVAGREIVPEAVKRDYVLTMIENNTEPVEEADEDRNTFTVPYEARTKNGILMPPGTHFAPDSEFSFRVLGVAPANNADNTFVPVGRYEAATQRITICNEPTEARFGVDVARFGNDFGTLYSRLISSLSSIAWRAAQFTKQDTNEYFREIKLQALRLPETVTSLHIRVDGGGGFGGGVVDKLKNDTELSERFADFKVFEVHNNGTAYNEKAYKNIGTEMYAEAAETLKGLALGSVSEFLEADLCERKYTWVNSQGVDVKVLRPKDEFKKEHKRSPDDGDGFVLAVAPDFLFTDNDVTKPNPLAMMRSYTPPRVTARR